MDTTRVFNSDIDTSEEMEEIRELLYDLVKSKFPAGVVAEHLAKVYRESYETGGLGPKLPENWLEHVQIADEFEVIDRGPLIMVYTRQRDVSSINVPIFSQISPQDTHTESLKHRIRLTDKELAQQMKPVYLIDAIVLPSFLDVLVLYCQVTQIFIQFWKYKCAYEKLGAAMNAYYENEKGEVVLDPDVDGAYAVKDKNGCWQRAICKSEKEFFLIDIGHFVAVEDLQVRRLRAEYALPRVYPIFGFYAQLDPAMDPIAQMKEITEAQCAKRPINLRFISNNLINGTNVFTVQAIGTERFKIKNGEEIILMPMKLSEMPKNKFSIHVLAAFAADNISIRQCSLDPIPDYIANAVKRDSLSQKSGPPFSELRIGNFYAARLQLNFEWERVQLLGPSNINADCFRVYAVDNGGYSVVKRQSIRHLKLPTGLRKILMAKSKVAGICPKDSTVWDRESQIAVKNILEQAKLVEVEPVNEWMYSEETGSLSIPFVEAHFYVDGMNLAEILIMEGQAERV